MINSHEEYVAQVRALAQNKYTNFDESSGEFYTTYNATKVFAQRVAIGSPPRIGLLTGGSVVDTFTRGSNGALILRFTQVSFLGQFLLLAGFLALTILWDYKEPIIWQLTFSSDEYAYLYADPLHLNPVSYSYVPLATDLLPALRNL